jgi:protein-S-isoprenylcysteine O-methyltransferase Ste14
MDTRTSYRHWTLFVAAVTGFLPSTLCAHDLDAQGSPMPTWLIVVGLLLLGSVGGAVVLVLKNHRRSIEARRKAPAAPRADPSPR